VRDDDGWVFLERRGDRHEGHFVFDGRENLQRVGHRHIELARREKLQAVHLRSAHADRHVEPVLSVRAFGKRLVVAAVFGLREPVGREDDALRRLRVRAGDENACEEGRKGSGTRSSSCGKSRWDG
jgi:hypothetical protein